MPLVPSKGVLTQLCLTNYLNKMNRNKSRYEYLMRDLLQNQLNFEKVHTIIEEELAKDTVFKCGSLQIILNLNLNELFRICKEKNIWIRTDNGKLIDFMVLPSHTHDTNSSNYREFFSNCSILKDWRDNYLKLWFDGGYISSGDLYFNYKEFGGLDYQFLVCINV